MAFLVPVSSTNPNCSLPISGHILLLNLKSKTLRMIFVTWLIRLIVQCCSQSTALGFFGSVMKMDLLKSSGNFRSLSWILLMISVSFSTPCSSKASIISMTTPSGPAALFFLIILIAILTSDLRILGLSIKSQKLGIEPLTS